MNEASTNKILEQTHLADLEAEKAVFSQLSRLILPEMVVIDIGAGTGQFTCNLSKVITRCSIYAVEAEPLQFKQLHVNCLKWEENSDNCIYTLQAVVTDKDEAKSLVTDNPDTIAFYKLDSLFKIIAPDFIKIKADGNPLKILKGSSSILRKGKARFLIKSSQENQSTDETDSAKIDALMNSFGYYSRDFYGNTLFTNTSKRLGYVAKRLYRQLLPETLRRWIKKWD